MKHYMKRKRPVADWFLFISWKHTQFNKFCRKVIADANYKGLVFEGDGSLRMTDSLARAQDSDICALDRYYCHPRGGFGTVGCKVFQTSAIGDAAAYWRSTASMKINNRPMIIMEYTIAIGTNTSMNRDCCSPPIRHCRATRSCLCTTPPSHNETKMEKALKFDLQEFVEKMKTKNVLPRENRSIFSSNRPRGYS